MNWSRYKNYVRILLLLLAAAWVYSMIDSWRWHKYSDTDVIQEVFKTLPPSASSGRKIAVISNVNSVQWELLRGYAGISPEVDIILEPDDLKLDSLKLKSLKSDSLKLDSLKSLHKLAIMLPILAKGKLVARLTFFGVGETVGKDKVELSFRNNQQKITRDDFIKLCKEVPNLPSAFDREAQVVFFNCWAGSDYQLLKAAGEAFLRQKGGVVIANTGFTNFDISSSGMFWSKKYAILNFADRPDKIDTLRDGSDQIKTLKDRSGKAHWVLVKIPAESEKSF